jgi:MraZ protein
VERNSVRHPVLYGEFELTIDDKNRLLVPADVRHAFLPEHGEAFFVVLGMSGHAAAPRVPWMYPERYYEEMAMQAPSEMTPGEDRVAFDQMYYGLASRVPWDKQGRVLVPDRTLKRAGIGKDVTLIGARDHLELWNRSDWEARREELERRSAEIAARARHERSAKPPSPSHSESVGKVSQREPAPSEGPAV